MTRTIPTFPSLIAVLACSAPFVLAAPGLFAPARAQVTSNLENLPEARKPEAQKPAKPATKPHSATPARSAPAKSAPARSAAARSAPSGPVTHASAAPPGVPPAPPPPAVIPPPFVPVQLHPPVPPGEVKPVAEAKNSVQTLPDGGTRVLFAGNSADLNPAALDALRALGKTLATRTDRRVILVAHATLPGDDISMPRRISLARALAVRSILINAGVATTRIYPRALGRPDPGDTAPADRLDILTETNPPADTEAGPHGTTEASEKK